MDEPAVGGIVLVLFPFSNLKGQKLRPALVLAKVEFANYILCQITSRPYSSTTAIKLTQADFVSGGLPVVSFVRPDKLFTADASLVEKVVGKLAQKKRLEILNAVQKIFAA
ncbi:TPA: MazF family transcriptional regulator [Patescibacteria group bacterium]|uniref:Transcriptional modulator of MazE/toxin, MazF n=1 Tax=Candidatus Gottesmanbacteria bacterium GW2011_GWA1_43_11 TaxID=1618436 RepID=A0A0G1FFJ3_9BACT|nr:MAG: hypothetical protein UV59_C0006G0069 [Candidatus Gottesmanbacteria bacterium GW2011_GWA1_43_11]HCS79200.1 MazF family transcriptional regulator [Patescibacteria group bacterium]